MRRGFTLVEVIAVLLVLALAAGVVAPSVGRSVDALRGRAGVASVASFLRAAREQAITRETVCEVSLASDGQAFVLRAGPTRLAIKALSPVLRIVGEPTRTPPITFYPQGFSSGGRLQIAGPGASRYLLTVDAMTGRVATRRAAS